MPTLAESLLGVTLNTGWRVIATADPPAAAAGVRPSVGQFSRIYIVERDGVRAFLKAIDMSAMLVGANAATVMRIQLNQFEFERAVLKACEDKRLSRIVRILAADEYHDPAYAGPVNSVPYIVFELAGKDARQVIAADDQKGLTWALKVLHNTAVGLNQLHRIGITHQDVKLSNIFDFGEVGLKLGDLGRAIPRVTDLAVICPHITEHLAGDRTYAPPELLYNAPPSDWEAHWIGADLYLLGSLVVSLFLGAGMTPMLFTKLAPEHRPNGWVAGGAWAGSYSDVLPYVRAAYEEVLRDLEVSVAWMSERTRNELTSLARDLCEPDTALRGDRKSISARRPHDLERVVSRLNLLAERVSIEAMRKSA
jgi:serine/threonine protein kinase